MVHPQAEASYRVVPINGDAYGVEVSSPEAEPALVSRFATPADADAWITRQKARVLESRPNQRFRRRIMQHDGSKQLTASE